MIILSFYTFLYSLLLLKDFFFISFNFFLDKRIRIMVFIFPMVYFLISLTSFNFVGKLEIVFFNCLCMFVVFFLFFCFRRSLSFFFLIFLENCVVFIVFLIGWFSKDLDKISSFLFIFFINIFPSILFIYFCILFPYNLISSLFFCIESIEFFCFFCY